MSLSIEQQIKAQLEPALKALVEEVSEREEPVTEVFFRNLLGLLERASSEEDLLLFSMELSTCAFVGLDYGFESAASIDGLLALAEGISHAMTADPGSSH